jgi:cyclophilin family peptidyl-prolyl cis-trans isomerase
VGLARTTAAHSGNAEFYVNLVDNPDLDPVPTRWGYAVFGRVVQGMDVIDKICEAPTGSVGQFKQDAPLKPIIIESATVVASTAPPAAQPVTPAEPQKILSPK